MAQVALITGASSGIGAELARVIAADGLDVLLTARSEQALQSLADELQRQHHVRATVAPADLARPDGPGGLVDRLAADGVTVDLLVNCAGLGDAGPFAEGDVDRQLAMMQVNVAALVHLTRLLLPGMIARGRGGVLNVGSLAGFQPGPFMAVYYATKAFVLSFSEALSAELARKGITVTCLAPGPVDTPFVERAGMGKLRMMRFAPADARAVAEAGYRGWRAGKAIVIPGWRGKLAALASKLAPRSLVRRIVKRINRPGSRASRSRKIEPPRQTFLL